MNREQTTIRLPAELLEQLKREADRMGISVNERIVALIIKGLDSE